MVVWLILTENYRVKESQGLPHWTTSVFSYVCMCSVAQSCPTLCTPIARQAPLSVGFSCKNTGVSCHFLLQGTSQPRDWTCVSCISHIGKQILYHCPTWDAWLRGPLEDSPGERGMTSKGGSPGTMLSASSFDYKGKKSRKLCKEIPGRWKIMDFWPS